MLALALYTCRIGEHVSFHFWSYLRVRVWRLHFLVRWVCCYVDVRESTGVTAIICPILSRIPIQVFEWFVVLKYIEDILNIYPRWVILVIKHVIITSISGYLEYPPNTLLVVIKHHVPTILQSLSSAPNPFAAVTNQCHHIPVIRLKTKSLFLKATVTTFITFRWWLPPHHKATLNDLTRIKF